MGVRCSKAIARSEITRGFGVSENLHFRRGGKVYEKDFGSFSINVFDL